jgi:hypothetical protein
MRPRTRISETMPPFIVIQPEDISKARVLYERTSVPVRDIARLLGIGTTTFMKRVKIWEWTPRNRSLAELDAAAKANVPIEEIRDYAETHMAVLNRASLIERVRASVARQIVEIDLALMSVDGAKLRTPDRERAARAMAALVKTLRETDTLEKASDEVPGVDEKENQFRDLDEFRQELVARLDRLRAAGDPG